MRPRPNRKLCRGWWALLPVRAGKRVRGSLGRRMWHKWGTIRGCDAFSSVFSVTYASTNLPIGGTPTPFDPSPAGRNRPHSRGSGHCRQNRAVLEGYPCPRICRCAAACGPFCGILGAGMLTYCPTGAAVWGCLRPSCEVSPLPLTLPLTLTRTG